MDKGGQIRVLVVSALGAGGVSTLMTNLQALMDREKINFDYLVFHRERPYRADLVEGMGSRIYVASADEVKIQALRRIVRMRRIQKICRENRIQILHYNADFAADLTNIIAARAGGVKYVVMHAHNTNFTVPGKGVQIASWLMKPFLPLFVDYFWACSDLVARFVFPKRVIKSRRYAMLPNGIDLKRYAFCPEKRSAVRREQNAEGKFVIGHAGRFVEQKNHVYLLEIFAEIRRKTPSALLWLFGTGVLFERMREKARQLGIEEAVTFFGVVKNMDEMWQAMDVLVMPSLHEGLPVAGIEAQASGLPCIFSDTITREVDVSGTSVFLPLASGPQAWADAVLALRDQKRADQTEKLKRSRYDIHQMADTISAHYLNLM